MFGRLPVARILALTAIAALLIIRIVSIRRSPAIYVLES